MKTTMLLRRADAAAARLVAGLPGLCLLAVLALATWRVAGWTWRFAPLPETTAQLSVSGGSAQAVVARHWFGEAPVAVAAAVPADAASAAGAGAAEAPADVRLLGVIAGGRRPVAMLQVGKVNHEVQPGEVFGDGLRLREVGSDHVILERRGQSFRATLPSVPAPQSGEPNGEAKPPQAPPRLQRPSSKYSPKQ